MVLALTLILLLSLANASQARRPQKRLIIHVPFRIKTHHHTHTVYAHIRSAASSGVTSSGSGHKAGGAKQQTIYKILSFAMQGNGYGGPTGHGGHGGHGGQGGHGGHGQVAHKNGHGGGSESVYEIAPAAHQQHHSSSGVMYDDFHGGGVGGGGGDHGERAGRCSDGPHGYGDMLFNHFSRSSDENNEGDEFPEVEEYVDEDEQGFEWE